MTQIASVSTNGQSLRSHIEGWSFEDSDLLVKKFQRSDDLNIFIGYTPSPTNIPYYGTVLEMLADGWLMLGPPIDERWTTEEGLKIDQWGWWLTRDTKR
jgi:hypothetical protein